MLKSKRGAVPQPQVHLAAREGHAKMVRILVKELGAMVDAVDEGGNTPLHLAACNGHTDALRVLVRELGSDVWG